MAGVFDIDLDQPDENVSDDEIEDGVSLCEHWGQLASADSFRSGLNVHYRTLRRNQAAPCSVFEFRDLYSVVF